MTDILKEKLRNYLTITRLSIDYVIYGVMLNALQICAKSILSPKCMCGSCKVGIGLGLNASTSTKKTVLPLLLLHSCLKCSCCYKKGN